MCNVCSIHEGKTQGEKSHHVTSHRWIDDRGEIGYEDVNWMELVQDENPAVSILRIL
jgi:hypothetical protein